MTSVHNFSLFVHTFTLLKLKTLKINAIKTIIPKVIFLVFSFSINGFANENIIKKAPIKGRYE